MINRSSGMGSLRTRSFFMGMMVASVTWAIIIYLYYSLIEDSGAQPHHKIPSQHLEGPREPLPLGESVKGGMEGISKLKQGSGNSNKITKNRSRGEIVKTFDMDTNSINTGKRKKYESSDIFRKKFMKNPIEKTKVKNDKVAPGADEPTSEQVLAELGLVKTHQDQEEREKGYRLHAFNTLISSRLSLDRSIPDTRNKRCKDIVYPDELPTTSIVICFFREESFALLRTVHSILNRTPLKLLEEIILVDDTDEESYHQEVLSEMRGLSDKIRILRTPKREGLIRARVFGAQQAVGQTLT